jgi:hypothetical protein
MRSELEALEVAMANLRATCAAEPIDYSKVLEAWQELHRDVYSMQDSFWDKIDWAARSREQNPQLYLPPSPRQTTVREMKPTSFLMGLLNK